jgi:aspartate aminotransferase
MDSERFRPSRNLEQLELPAAVSVSREVQRRRAAGEDVFDLVAGDLDFGFSRGPVDVKVRTMQHGNAESVPLGGILDLRAAAARYFSLLSGGRPVNADNILVSSSARQALFNACFTLFDVGDDVLIASPCRTSYPDLIRLARARPIRVEGDVEWSLKVGVAELESAASVKTSGLLIGTPVNPTGAVYTRSELKAILSWAVEREVWVLCDEQYRRIHYGSGPAPSVLDLPDELLERVVMISSTGVPCGMRGWGIGLALAPRSLVEWMTALQALTVGPAPRPNQLAAAAAYADERVDLELDRMVGTLRSHRDLAVEQFRQNMPGVEFVEPLGACFLYFRVDSCFGARVSSATEFCEHLLSEQGVAVMSGDGFGDGRWARLSYAVSERILTEALPRICEFAATAQA